MTPKMGNLKEKNKSLRWCAVSRIQVKGELPYALDWDGGWLQVVQELSAVKLWEKPQKYKYKINMQALRLWDNKNGMKKR